METGIAQKVAQNIKSIRLLRGFSQEYLAQLVNKSQNWIQKVESAQIELSIENIEIIANALEVDITTLLQFDPKQIFLNCSNFGGVNYYNNNNTNDIKELIKVLKELIKTNINN